MSKTLIRALYLSLLIFSIGLPIAHAAPPEKIRTLIGKLQDINPSVRRDAAWALYRIGEKATDAVPALIEALGDSDRDVRRNAIVALGGIGEKAAAAVPALIKALGDIYRDIRRFAADALFKIGEPAVPALSEALKDSNEDVRWHAIVALGGIGEKAAAAVPALIEALRDSNADVRQLAAKSLVEIGEPAVPALNEALNDRNEIVRSYAVVALEKIREKMSPPIFPRLRALFTSKTKNPREYWENMLIGGYLPGSRIKAANELANIADPRSVPILIDAALKDSNKDVRINAARALGRIGKKAAATVPALIEALKDSDVYVRWKAALALGDIGEKAAAAVPALIEALKDSNGNIRIKAAWALGRLGEKAAAAVPALIEALKDSNVDVRINAAIALGSIGEKAAAAIPALIEARENSDLHIAKYAADALKQIRKDATAEQSVEPSKESKPDIIERPESMPKSMVEELAYEDGKRLFIDRKKILGEGNLKVYEGFLETNPETGEGHLVAIKMGESGEDRTYLRRQHEQQGKIDDPHVVKVYGIHDDPDRPFLVMEHVAGKTLRERLKAGEISYDEAIRIAYEIAKGLEAAHKERIVHGDLKPENILLDGEHVKLTDFEGKESVEKELLSRSLRSQDTGGQIATLAYMAPEQRSGEPATTKSDVHAFGTILYEMINGKRPESDLDPLSESMSPNTLELYLSITKRSESDLDSFFESKAPKIPKELRAVWLELSKLYESMRKKSRLRPEINRVLQDLERWVSILSKTGQVESVGAEKVAPKAAMVQVSPRDRALQLLQEGVGVDSALKGLSKNDQLNVLEAFEAERGVQDDERQRKARRADERMEAALKGTDGETAQPTRTEEAGVERTEETPLEEAEKEPDSRRVLLEGETVRELHRDDSGKMYIPFSDTIVGLMDHWRERRVERAEEERKGAPLDAVRNGSGGSSFAGSLTKFSLAVALKEAMKEALTGKDANFSHIFSDEQVVGYGSFSATAALGENLSVRVGDGIASRTGLKAFSSKASMISPYRLGSYAFFMTLGMQADQIARLTLAGMKDHKDVTVALSEALHIWWSQFEVDEAALTTAGFLAAKPLISPFVRAVQSRWIEAIRNLQKTARWGHRGLKVLEGATGNLPFMVIEEAIVLLTVDILMEEYVEWKKEGELKEKVANIFKQLEGEVQSITKDNARESAANMAALFEELRAVRIGVIHTEEGKVKDKYDAFQKALNELLDHKSGMFWKDTKAMLEGWNIRKSPEYEACQAMRKEAFGGRDYDGSQFERNYLCGHLAFLKIWASKLENVKKLYAEYQLAYAKSENKVNHKKALTFDFLRNFDLSAIHSDVVLDIKHSNIRDIYQLEQSYYGLALQKIAKKFSEIKQEAGFFVIPSEHGDDMKAISDAINQVKEESMAGEIVFETSTEQIREEDVKAELKRADLMPVILAEILKEDKFWIELGVGAKNGDGIFSTFNPTRIHVINDANCVLSEMLGISDDVVSLETRDERAWLSCDQFVERPLPPDEYRRREKLGSFIDAYFAHKVDESAL